MRQPTAGAAAVCRIKGPHSDGWHLLLVGGQHPRVAQDSLWELNLCALFVLFQPGLLKVVEDAAVYGIGLL